MNTGESWPGFDEAWSRVRRMQAELHWWAIHDPDRVFDDLHNLVSDPAFLVHAWERVHGNKGGRTAGIDGVTPRSIPKVSTALLARLRTELRGRTFRPQPVREKLIPKPGNPARKRRLGIPTTADRVVQASLKLVLEPIFEADFQPGSYGFRPRRRAQDAIAEIHKFGTQGYVRVLEADIEACFDRIDHPALMDRVRHRVGDKRVLVLVKSFLKAGVLSEDGVNRDTLTGTPQGGILSPLLANIALSVLDDHYQHKWDAFSAGKSSPNAGRQGRQRERRNGGATYRLVRYADDFVVLVFGELHHAEQARTEVAHVLAPMGLTLSDPKTHVVHMDTGFDFLGWRVQRRTKPGTVNKMVIHTFPSKKSLASIMRKVKHHTRRSAPYKSLADLLIHLNRAVRGWCLYFRHGVSFATYRYLDHHTRNRVARWIYKRHPRLSWRRMYFRFFTPGTMRRPVENGIALYNPQDTGIKRYRWRGHTIPTPWSSLAAALAATTPA